MDKTNKCGSCKFANGCKHIFYAENKESNYCNNIDKGGDTDGPNN